MNFRQMNLNVFSGAPIPHVLFQPRFEPWYDWQKQFGHLPEQYRDCTLMELCDAFQVSIFVGGFSEFYKVFLAGAYYQTAVMQVREQLVKFEFRKKGFLGDFSYCVRAVDQMSFSQP